MKRPLTVTIMSLVFMIAGITGIIYHASDLKYLTTDLDVVWVLAVRIAAVIGGWFSLQGKNWARWLLVIWIVYHVLISFYHTTEEVAVHVLFTALTVAAFFNTKANAYFAKRS